MVPLNPRLQRTRMRAPLSRKPLSSAKDPVNAKSLEIVQRYLAGDLDLEAAAHAIHTGGDFGLQYSPGTTSAADQERIEALFGRVFWLSMREADPARVPDKPFGAEEFRAIAKECLALAMRDSAVIHRTYWLEGAIAGGVLLGALGSGLCDIGDSRGSVGCHLVSVCLLVAAWGCQSAPL